MLNFIKKRKLIVFVIAMVFVLIPFSLSQQAETEKVAVVTSLGLDKQEDKLLLSANIVVPNSGQAGSGGGTDGTVKTVCVVGEDVSTAFSNLTLLIGKMPGLAHCDSIIINKELFEEDVTKYIDFFVRTNNLTSNASIIVAEKDAKTIIETSAEQKGLRAVSLSEIFLLNNEYSLGEKSNIDYFYLNYFSKPNVAMVPVLNSGDSKKPDNQIDSAGLSQENESQNKLTSQSRSVSGSSGGGEGESENGGESASGRAQKIIKNDGKGAIIKNGRLVSILSTEQMRGISLIDKKTKRGHVKIENVTGNGFINADLCFEIFDKTSKKSGVFLGGIPVFNFDIDLVVKLEEVVMENLTLNNMKSVKNYVTGNIKTELEKTLEKEIAQVVDVAKTQKADVLGVYEYFHKYHTKKWHEFLSGLENPDDYLNHVTFTCDFKIQAKI